MRTVFKVMRQLALAVCFVALVSPAMAQEETPVSQALITNASIFDGQNEKLAEGMSVLIEGNKISKIAKSIPVPADAEVIDAGGRVLMPGLIDAHWHVMYANTPVPVLANSENAYITLVGAKGAGETLLRGFTTVRDIGGIHLQ